MTKLDEVIVGQKQVLNALISKGHKILTNETLNIESNTFNQATIDIPKNTRKIVVIYLE